MAMSSSLSKTKQIIPVHFVKEGEFEFEDNVEMQEPTECRDLIPIGVFSGHDWALQQHGEGAVQNASDDDMEREKKKKKKLRRQPSAVKTQLYVKFCCKRPTKNEIMELHPDIISVTEPNCKKRFCFLNFIDEESANRACTELKQKKVNGSWLRVYPRQRTNVEDFGIFKKTSYKGKLKKMRKMREVNQNNSEFLDHEQKKLSNEEVMKNNCSNEINYVLHQNQKEPLMKQWQRKTQEEDVDESYDNETNEPIPHEPLMKQWQRKAQEENVTDNYENETNELSEPLMKQWQRKAQENKLIKKRSCVSNLNKSAGNRAHKLIMRRVQRKAKFRKGMLNTKRMRQLKPVSETMKIVVDNNKFH